MITAKDVMVKNVKTIKPDESIAKTISMMEKEGLKELPIVDENKRLLGMITYYDILDFFRTDPKEKVSNLKFTPPAVTEETEITEIAKLMLQSGIEAIPVINKENKVIGIISDYDLINVIKKDQRILKTKVQDIMREEVIKLSPTDTLSTARRIMRFHNIDRLPVIDENGKLMGMVISIDIIRFLFKKPKEKMGRQDRAGRIKSPFEFPVKSVMRKKLPEIRPELKAITALNRLLEENLKGSVVTDKQNRVVGMFFRKDLLEKVFGGTFEEGVWVNFSGYPLKRATLEVLKGYLSSDIKKIKTLSPDLKNINVHIQRLHAASEDKWNYEIGVTLVYKSGKRVTLSNQKVRYGYNLMFTLQEAFKRLRRYLESRYRKRGGKNYYA